MNTSKHDLIEKPLTVMTIAGSDPTAGAGIQADLKVFKDFGLYGTSAITAVTVQNTKKVVDSVALEPELVTDQIEEVKDDIRLSGIKLGMLATSEIAESLGRLLSANDFGQIVIDPVLKSTSGFDLFPAGMQSLYTETLFPLAAAITPNREEAEALLGLKINGVAEGLEAAAELSKLGPSIVSITGIEDAGLIIDVIIADGRGFTISADPVSYRVHGTGCIYSAALLSSLVLGNNGEDAARAAHSYTQRSIRKAKPLGKGSLLVFD